MVEITKKRDINLRVRFTNNELADAWRSNPDDARFAKLNEVLTKYNFVLLDQMARFHALDNDADGDAEKKAMVAAVLADPERTDYYNRVFVAGMVRGDHVFDRLTVRGRVKSLITALKDSEFADMFDVQGFAFPESKFQIRLVLTDEFTDAVAGKDTAKVLKQVVSKLDKGAKKSLRGLNLAAVTQFDNFKAYVAQARASGMDKKDGDLADWTAREMAKPEKRHYYSKTLSLLVDGVEMNTPEIASVLKGAFEQLAGKDVVEKIKVADDNPANNPQAPRSPQR